MTNLAWLGTVVWLTIIASPVLAERTTDLDSVRWYGAIDVTERSEVISERRLAYVIGNNDYQHVTDLKNADSDARLVAAFLRAEGYLVVERYGLTKIGFEKLLREIARDTDESTHVVIYYAGHGIQIGEVNYLIPVDATLVSSSEVSLQAVSLGNIMEIAKSRSRTLVIFLDSCRDNPFEGQEVRAGISGDELATQGGFFAQQAPINSFLAYSTSPGMLAEDGAGRHSPFTEALVSVARDRRTESIERVMQEVRRRVYDETDSRQLPWESTSLVEVYYLANPELLEPRIQLAESLPLSSQLDRTIELATTLEKNIDIGGAISSVLGTPPEMQFQVLEPPSQGHIEEFKAPEGPVQVGYRPSLDSLPARRAPLLEGVPTLRDNFVVSVDDQVVGVRLTSEVNRCDFEAGDHLDADGVGIARYPNEIEPQAALEACLAAVADAPGIGRFHYQLGRAYTALRDLKNARASYDQARTLGHARAYYALGVTSLGEVQETSGRLEELASPEILSYFAAGAERGDPYAMHGLGRQYLLFSDDPERQDEGFGLLVRSAEMGHTFSMNALGEYFLDERRAERDGTRGLKFWRASADRADIYGLANMGAAYNKGLGGLERDVATAVDLLSEASEGGHPVAPVSLGILYASGDGVMQNPQRALDYFDLSLSRGNGYGGTNGAMMILTERVKGKIGDAAWRSAKAYHLSDRSAAAIADQQLAEMTSKEIDAGAQAIMLELGADVAVDGAFGSDSSRALAELEKRYGIRVGETAIARLKDLAKVYWLNNKFRVDLY